MVLVGSTVGMQMSHFGLNVIILYYTTFLTSEVKTFL